jgi:hypothetical protein
MLVMSEVADLSRFYAILEKLEASPQQGLRLDAYKGASRLPDRGVYFFREPGEHRPSSTDAHRIVRVGTHAVSANSKSTLWQRLRAHLGTRIGGGNHRGSIFRLHVGAALLAREGVEIATWGVGTSAPEALRGSRAAQAEESRWEQKVSEYISAMTILWVDVPDEPGPASVRAVIERNAIALLSNRFAPLEAASGGWLGRHSPRGNIQRSGLWNVTHVDQAYDPRFLDLLESAVEQTIGGDRPVRPENSFKSKAMLTFFQPDANPDDLSQQCPLCGVGQPASSRYPDYICTSCVADARNDMGRPVDFQNTAMSGGYEAVCIDTGQTSDSHRCFIRGIECYAGEAKFGGVVVTPSISAVSLEDLSRFSVSALLAAHSTILAELKERRIVRSMNNPTGDYTEWLVSSRLGLRLETNSAKGFDACDAGGVRYQIKGRRCTSANPSTQLGVIRNLKEQDFDVLAAVVFDEDWEVTYAALIPHAVVAEVAQFRPHVRGHVMRLTRSIVARSDVEDISELLRR